jgi:hypothetical protein
MQLEVQEIVEWLARKGRVETAFEVEGALPPHVDTERDRALLSEAGLDVDELVSEVQRGGH